MDDVDFGRYRLIAQLGQGGMGEVWRAHDTELDRMVAIKMLLPHFAKDPKFEERFRREARAAARLDDPHVVPIYDVGQIDDRLYVSMRLINGHDLQTLLDGGPLEPHRAVAITAQIAQALHAAHTVGLVHRDIKPSNILVAEHDFAYLIDFGIARAAGETGLTSTAATIGTWSYMSPERFSTGLAEPSSDIYALTCVLYQCLTGQLPFPAVALEQIAVAHMTAPPPRPSAQRPDVPVAMDDVISTGLAKDPAQRYATTQELAAAARSAVNAAPPTPAQPEAAVPVTHRPSPPLSQQPRNPAGLPFTSRGPSPFAASSVPPTSSSTGVDASTAQTLAAPTFLAPQPGPISAVREAWWKQNAIAITAVCAVASVAIALPIIFAATAPPGNTDGPSLLTVKEVNRLLGVTNYRLIDAPSRLEDPILSVTPAECNAIARNDLKVAFAEVGANVVADQTLHGIGNDDSGSVDQLLAETPSPEAANRFVQQRLRSWRSCEGKEYQIGSRKWTAKVIEDRRSEIIAKYVSSVDNYQCEQTYAVSGATIAHVTVCDFPADVIEKASIITSRIVKAS